jgi:PAS domain-containing protein
VEQRTAELQQRTQNLQQEITERKRAEQMLRESEAQIRQLVESSLIAMLVSSRLEQQVDFVNQQFVELFGYSLVKVPDVPHWWPLAYPDEAYRESFPGLFQAHLDSLDRHPAAGWTTGRQLVPSNPFC